MPKLISVCYIIGLLLAFPIRSTCAGPPLCELGASVVEQMNLQWSAGGNNGKTVEAARTFVRRFYEWYVPVALRAADNSKPAWPVALKDRGPAFSHDLRKALTDDAEAQAKVKGYIVGLDFDPFLNTQDPCDSYEVGAAKQGGSHYLVEIYAVCSGEKSKKPSVLAELAHESGSWVFTNFRYPGKGPDLLRNLRLLREERQKSTR